MKLSELNFGIVEKDGEFNWLGLTAEEYEGKKVLTFLNDAKYIKELKKMVKVFSCCKYWESKKEVDSCKREDMNIAKNENKLTIKRIYIERLVLYIRKKAKITEKINGANVK